MTGFLHAALKKIAEFLLSCGIDIHLLGQCNMF